LGLLFAIPALSLAGVPPLSGFWAKFFVLKSGFDAGWYVLSAIALLTGILTLYSMLKIWLEAFWKEPPEGTPELPPITGATRLLLLAPVAGLGLVTVTIGLWTEPFAAFAMAAGEQLASREAYITAVMGVPRP
jgi:multicomponent Na+:H+ antiporter subunit D